MIWLKYKWPFDFVCHFHQVIHIFIHNPQKPTTKIISVAVAPLFPVIFSEKA